ncbi:hypothetical protein NM688_g2102 [Phlebia brevispora]|uniref:Uncharacterized protein n=1 Tax=Phlebia brevispora TaxID=194682 RepID=A0ACC1T9F7_9APHY|nr:hypothetical protein NM688_g2102 [Phlebia brevispora]
MHTQNSPDLVYDTQSWKADFAVVIAGAALLLYDHALTSAEEVRCIWRRRPSSVTVIFFLLRYIPRLSQGVSIIQFMYPPNVPSAPIVCDIVGRLNAVLVSISYLTLGAFAALRTYAILAGNVKLAVLIFSLSLIAVGGDAYYNHIGRFMPAAPPLRGCVQPAGDQTRLANILSNLYLSVACLVSAETIVQIGTWRKTLDVHRSLRDLNIKRPLTQLILRDGTAAFLLLSIWAALVQTVKGVHLDRANVAVISIVLCRCMLLLRQVYISSDSLAFRTISAAALGNVGAPLDMRSVEFGTHVTEEDLEDDPVYISADPFAEGLQLD